MLLLHTQKPFFFWNAPNPPYSGSWRPFFAFPIVLRQDKTLKNSLHKTERRPQLPVGYACPDSPRLSAFSGK